MVSSSCVSVVIPNWNGREFLSQCLDALRAQTFKDFQVVVVDNGSTDGSAAFVQIEYPEIQVIALSANLGFSRAVNIGIRSTSSPYVALLNNDTEADPYWLEALLEALEDNPQVGFCASKMLFHNDRTRINSAGLFFRIDGVGRDIGFGQEDSAWFRQRREVFGACGGAAIFRRTMLDDVGLLDEDFYAYGEDLDLSFQAQLKGYKCLYVPEAIVYHHGSATFGQASEQAVFYGSKNMVNVIVKNMPSALLRRYLLRVLMAQAYQVVYFTAKGRGKAVLRGKLAAMRELRKMLAKRREILRTRRVSDEYIDSILSHTRGRRIPFVGVIH